MDELPPEAWEKAAGPYGQEMAKVVPAYLCALFWVLTDRPNGFTDPIRNGTTFFLDAGRGPFGVTAGHVFDGYCEWAGDVPRRRCQLGGTKTQSLDLRKRLIARGKRIDLATYSVTPQEVAATGVQILGLTQSSWPPPPPAVGDVVVFGGFPGVDRGITRFAHITFGYYSGGGLIDSVSDQHLTSIVRHEYMVELPGLKKPGPGYDIAGMSGGPVLVVGRGDVVTWRLGGIISDGGTQLLEMVKAVRADLIAPDGTLLE